MTMKYVDGDLFAGDYEAICHGVNLKGVMGSGIAVTFKHHYPDMYREYKKRCKEHTLNLGSFYRHYDVLSDKYVYNLATQRETGPNAYLTAVQMSVTAMIKDAETLAIQTIGIPRIGAGIGGLDWVDAHRVIFEICEPSRIQCTIVTYAK